MFMKYVSRLHYFQPIHYSIDHFIIELYRVDPQEISSWVIAHRLIVFIISHLVMIFVDSSVDRESD